MSKKFAYIVAAFLGGYAISEFKEYAYAQDSKPPKWSHGIALKARKGDEDNFTKDTKKYGVEVFVDDNNGNLIYISETGSISVVKK
jgi:hypothetical protein